MQHHHTPSVRKEPVKTRLSRLAKKKVIAIALLALVSLGALLAFNGKLKAATFGWLQTSWSGGADTSNFPSHASNQTGWTKFFSKDANVDVTSSPGDAKLIGTSAQLVETSNTDFATGTNTNVAVTGTGSGASVTLLKPAGATCSADAECSNGGCSSSACLSACDATMTAGQLCMFGGVRYGFVSGADGKIWMDRNLGAKQVATASNDQNSYGWLYQWGRLSDGNQYTAWGAQPNPTLSATTSTLSSSDTPGHANFITNGSSPYDWRSPQNTNLWQGVSGVNNPCPSGFRLPTQSEWEAWVGAAGVTNAATAYASTLKLPLAGYRLNSNASLLSQGSYGNYWSSSPTGAYSYYLYFNSSSVDPAYSYYRAFGFTVRCLKN